MLASASASAAPGWHRFDATDRVLRLELHVQPGASRTEVTGPHGGRLKVRLAGAAIDGKANALLIELLGELFSVPLRNVTIVRGSTQRHKTIQIQNPGARMPALIAAWEQSAKESSP